MAKGGRSPVSGWIKFEKKLRDDIRVKRMARALMQLAPSLCNGTPLHGETVCITIVLGALAKLWMHADTFAREDDTLDLTAAEVDEMVGVDGFASLLPPKWLELIDEGEVKLPNFQSHNGAKAKERALTADRVANHRYLHGNGAVLHESEACNGQPLPDQTRLDQTRHTEERASVVPRETNPARAEGADAIARRLLERIQAAHPKGIYRKSDWMLVEREIRALLEEGVDPDVILAGVERYAAQIRARGREGTEFVMSPLRFVKERQFFEEFPLPKAEKRGQGQTREEQERDDMTKLMARRAAIPSLRDFRDPNPGESSSAYLQAQNDAWKAAQPRDLRGVVSQLAKAKAVSA